MNLKKKKPTPVRIDSDVYDKLVKIAKKEERSIHKTTNRILREVIKDREDK